ncbi:MAG: hypothetical protein JW928_00105, partial [Candidatus Aureabacteria bacterium]|nr:hypothetical protein [Candidatus Auribacterota bacterium]
VIYIMELLAGVEGRIKNSPSPYVYVEIMIVKMAHSGTSVPIEHVMKELHSLKKAFENAPEITSSPVVGQSSDRKLSADEKNFHKEVIKPTLEQLQDKWKDFLYVLEKKNKHLIKTHLQEGRIAGVEGNTVLIQFEESSVFQLDLLNQPTNIEFIEKELSSFFKTNLQLKIQMVPDSIKKKDDDLFASKPYDPKEKIKKLIKENEVIRESLDLFNGKIVGFKEPEKTGRGE